MKKREKLFERIEGESEQSFELFKEFCKMGPPRSISKFAKLIGKPEGTIGRLHATKRWSERVDKYDEMLDNVEKEAILGEKDKIVRRHLRSVEKLHKLAEGNVERLLREFRKGKGKGASLSPDVATRMLEKAINLERLMIGEVTERTGTEEQWDLSRLTTEELLELKRLKSKATKQEESESSDVSE